MRKIFLSLPLLVCFYGYVHAWPRLGAAANLVTQNAGNRAKCFSVTVGTTTPVLLFSASENYREVMVQNTDSTFYVHCGSFSAVNATAGTPRFLLPPKPTALTTNGNYNTYCVADPLAGSATIEILSTVEYNIPD